MTPDCIPLKELPDVKGQNFYFGVCNVFFSQFFLIFTSVSKENRIWNVIFKAHRLYKLLTPLWQQVHISPVMTTDGQILAPLLWV